MSAIQARLFLCQMFCQTCRKQLHKKRKATLGFSKSRGSAMFESWEEFITSIQRIWSSSTPWKICARNFLAVPLEFAMLCNAKLPMDTRRPCAQKTVLVKEQDIRVLDWSSRIDESAHWEDSAQRSWRSYWEGVQIIESNTILCTSLFPTRQAMNIPDAKSLSWQRVGEVRKIADIASGRKSEAKTRGHRMGRKTAKDCSLCNADGLKPPQELGIGAKVARSYGTLRWGCEGRLWFLCSNHGAGFVRITNDGHKSSGRCCKTARNAVDKQATQYQPTLSMDDAPESLKLFEVRMSGHMGVSTTMHVATELAEHSRASGPSGKELVRSPLCWIALRKTFFQKV